MISMFAIITDHLQKLRWLSTSPNRLLQIRLLSGDRCAGFLILLFLSLTGPSYAQNGPVCDTYTNKTSSNGLGSDFMYGVYAVGNMVYAATSGGLSISTDRGNTFTNKTTANGLGDNVVRAVYVAGQTVYAAGSSGLSISTDGGNTFTNKTTANGLGGNFVSGVYAVGNMVYAATNGGLSISTDGGSSFTNKTTADGLGNNTVYGVYVIGNIVYGATSGGLSISTDGGSSFTNKTTANGLGAYVVYGVYAVGNTVYAATVSGLGISTDGGSSFTNKTTANGLGNNYINRVYAVGNTVYAATNGGGLSISTDGGSSFINETTTNGLGHNSVLGVYVVGNTVYAATVSGLSFCDAGCVGITNRIYVKPGGTGNGSSWANATSDLQGAINNTCGVTEIWVAQGTYKPAAYPTSCTNCTSNRDFAFSLKDGVKVYGGFAGTEANLSDRNPASYTTTLSGDIGTTGDNSDNTYHVVISVNNTAATVLDGFTITGGNSNGTSGTKINGQNIDQSYGGLYVYGGSPVFNQLALTSNNSRNGGSGIYLESTANIALTNCTFTNNSAYEEFGSVYDTYSTNLSLSQCTFTGNVGTGFSMYYTNGLTFNNCTFRQNSASIGGAIYLSYAGAPVSISACTFDGNTAIFSGGAIYDNYSYAPVTITNTIFKNNSAPQAGGIFIDRADSYNHITHTIVNSLFTRNTGTSSTTAGVGGALYTKQAPVILINSTIADNIASKAKTGGIVADGSAVQLTNSILWGNTQASGTATEQQISVINSSTVTVKNSLIQDGLPSGFTNQGNNLSANPLFTDATNGNYQLAACSPAINVGSNSDNTTATDLAGNSRIQNTTIDLGAYEYQGGATLSVLYVKPGGTGNGASWATATGDLQAAINNTCGATQVWVAQGTYKPAAYPTSCTNCSSSRDYAFSLKDGVKVYGGFAGTEANLTDRNPASYTTILSGDIGTTGNNSDNTYHVVVSVNNTAATLLDGFTITGGNSNGPGTIKNIAGSSIDRGYGGGLYIINGSPVINQINVVGNTGIINGGGIGAYLESTTSLTISHSSFVSNTGGQWGSGFYDYYSKNLTIDQCTFTGNRVVGDSYGGAGYCYYTSGLTVSNCTFSQNVAVSNGGGLYGYGLTGNTNIISTTFDSNTATNPSNLVTAGYGGGFVDMSNKGNTNLTNCVFRNNVATYGGGILVESGSTGYTLTNCLFTGNVANNNNTKYASGGAIYNFGLTAPLNLINCTLVGNSASILKTGGVVVYGGSINIINSILWNNTQATGTTAQQQLMIDGSGSIAVKNSLIQDGVPSGITNQGNNLSMDPGFADATNGNYQLTTCSPAINTGSNSDNTTPTDLAGNTRIKNTTIDLGAYEFQGVSSITVSISATPSLTITSGQSASLTASGATSYTWNTGQTTASISATAAGTYSVTGTTGSCSNTATATVSLSVASGPILYVGPISTVTIGPGNCPGVMNFIGSGLSFTLTGPDYYSAYPVRGGAAVNRTIPFSGIKTTGQYTACAVGNAAQTPVCLTFTVTGQACP